MWFLCFSEYHLLQFIFVSLRRKFAVLSNPVPDRQPCSALCRVSFLGPLVQIEVMAGFPVKVSDWTVMYFYPKSIYALRVQRKPVHNIQSLSRKPVRIKRVKSVEFFYFQMPCCNVQHNIGGNTCQEKFSTGIFFICRAYEKAGTRCYSGPRCVAVPAAHSYGLCPVGSPTTM